MAEQYNNKLYDKIRVLGQGSFGTAIVHRRRADCSLVVLKEIDLQKFKGEQERSIAINEARIMSTLSHSNIIKYYNAYTTESKLIIEMEYASLGTLASYLTMHSSLLEEQEILVVFRQITSGLDYLHSKNIIHLDLKMTNIFVTVDGLVKIGDFGISQYMYPRGEDPVEANHPMKSIRSSHLGTLAYSSPERCLNGLVDFKADIWSLGCILYELITSRQLFTEASLPELVMSITRISYQPIRRKITPALKRLFEQMIAKDPTYRPTAFEIICIIDQLYAQSQLLEEQTRLSHKRQNYRFDLSTEANLFAADTQLRTVVNQIHYPRSLVYQVRLDKQHIQVERVNLPQSKRIKEISKGKSHYLVLTYDNIVYGWGSKTHGQLGACGLTSSSSNSGRTNLTRSARNSMNSKEISVQSRQLFSNSTTPTSLASSTQTISPSQNQNVTVLNQNQQTSSMSSSTRLNSKQITRQLVVSMLRESEPATRPFIINELNHRKIIQVAAGDNFSVFLSKTGIVMTCGDGSTGCLGRGQVDDACFTPCMVDSLLNMDIVSIACGPKHVVAICGNGRAYSWGKSTQGRLGIASQVGHPGSHLHMNGQLSEYILRPQLVQFPDHVFIKRAYCGDKCTLFIDSNSKCWACGENRFNKLGLDVKRRFKKTLMVDRRWLPTEISALSRYDIVACDIGKNHTSFITSEGKLIVAGQDIDYGYRLESDIIGARRPQRHAKHGPNLNGRVHKQYQSPADSVNSWRRVGEGVSNSDPIEPPEGFAQALNYKQLLKSMTINNQLTGFKYTADSGEQATTSNPTRFPRFKLSKIQQQQVDLFVKKARSTRKLPFECVISVSCTAKFTIALTNDNRVYFWGTRTHRRDPEDDYMILFKLSESMIDYESRADKLMVEPQLIPRGADDCFIKIGRTNNSLMSDIQRLGSDQPIIHAQDPRLTAELLSDLWILDYKPIASSDSDGSSLHSSGSCSSFTSCCETCCSLQSEPDRCERNDNLTCEVCERQKSRGPQTRSLSSIRDDLTMRHDAILTPQPIVSLYVPSMFNHPGCSLHLVDLFCFDEDKFYLVLDTTIKQVHQHQQPLGQSDSNLYHQHPNDYLNSHHQSSNPPKSDPSLAPSPRMRLNSVAEASNRVHNARSNDCDALFESDDVKEKILLQAEESAQRIGVATFEEGPVVTGRKEGVCDDDENNNTNSIGRVASLSTSHCGVSLEEPRSFSTFANALGNHIIIGPSMNARDDSMGRDESIMQALTFNSSASSSPANQENHMAHLISARNKRGRRRNRLLSNRSESTVFPCNDNEETSSMPSWVKNEYLQYQTSEEEDDERRGISEDQVFNIDTEPASDDRTCVGDASRSPSSATMMEIAIDGDDKVHMVVSQLRADSSSPMSSLAPSRSRSFNELNRAETFSNLEGVRQASFENYLGTVETIEGRTPKSHQRVSSSHPDIRDLRAQASLNSSCVGSSGSTHQRPRRNSDLDDNRVQPSRKPDNLISCQVYREQINGHAYGSSSLMTSTLSSRVNSHNLLLRPGDTSDCGGYSRQQIEGLFGPFESPVCQPLSHQVDVSEKFNYTNTADGAHQSLVMLNNSGHLSQSVQLHPITKEKRFSSTLSLQSLRRSLARLFC